MLTRWSNGVLRRHPTEDHPLNKEVDMATVNSTAQNTHSTDHPLADLPLYVQQVPHPVTQPAPPTSRHTSQQAGAHSLPRGSCVPAEWPLSLLEHRRRMPRPDVPVTLSIAITNKAPHELSRTTLTVINLLLTGDLLRLRSEEVADTLHISPTTLRRRLRADGTHYQSILDHIRRHRCTLQLEKRWLPGKCVAWELGYAEVNSFYRAFRRWTGHNYSDLKRLYL